MPIRASTKASEFLNTRAALALLPLLPVVASTKASESLNTGGRSPFLVWSTSLVWLPLIIPTIVRTFQTHRAAPHLIATLIGAALFFSVLLWATWRNAQRLAATSSLSGHPPASTWLIIAVLAALSLTLALLGGNEWQALFYFTSGYVGASLPLRRATLGAVAITLLAVAVDLLAGLGWLDLVQAVVFTSAIVFISRSVVWSITTSWELRAAREEIARLAVMTERLRIARDLHDLLGHNLSLIALKSELAGRLLGVAPERAAIEIGDVENVARTTLEEVREAVGSYRQPTLASELHGAQEILAAAGIVYRYEGDERIMGTLPTTIEALLSWTVREGVTNVIRHSRAQQCTICVRRERQRASVEVSDDGVGVSLVAASPISTGAVGNGLRGLAERVAALDGQFDAGPRANGGFRLAISVPLAQRNHDAEPSERPGASRERNHDAGPSERPGASRERNHDVGPSECTSASRERSEEL